MIAIMRERSSRENNVATTEGLINSRVGPLMLFLRIRGEIKGEKAVSKACGADCCCTL